MNHSYLSSHDPELDLSFERIVDVPVEKVWAAWTQPELNKQWFTPAPWKTIDCEIDLLPGGIFRTVMFSPAGQKFPNAGCYLKVVESERLIWTGALGPGFRPRGSPIGEDMGFAFTAVIALARNGSGTKYTARVIHGNVADRNKHAAMGFEEGRGKALDQLVAMVCR